MRASDNDRWVVVVEMEVEMSMNRCFENPSAAVGDSLMDWAEFEGLKIPKLMTKVTGIRHD